VTETRAIKTAFGSAAASRAVSSPKSMIGHLVGAAGIASAMAAIGGIRDQVISPTAHLDEPDPECDLDYVPNVARRAKIDTVMVNGFGFGGQNAVAVFRRYQGSRRAGRGAPGSPAGSGSGRECRAADRVPVHEVWSAPGRRTVPTSRSNATGGQHEQPCA
jgi:acyl transferase domain-containing protein